MSAPTPAPAPTATEPTIRFATEEDIPTILALIHELAHYEKSPSSVLATSSSLQRTLTFPSNPTHGYAKTFLIFPASPPSAPASTSTSTSTHPPSSSAPATSFTAPPPAYPTPPSTQPTPAPASTPTDPSYPTPPPSQPAATSPPRCAGMALFFTNYSTWRGAPGIYLEDLFVRPEYRGRGYGKRLLQRLARETEAMGGERLEWAVLKWNEPSLRFYEGMGARRLDEWVGMRVEGGALGGLARGESFGREGGGGGGRGEVSG